MCVFSTLRSMMLGSASVMLGSLQIENTGAVSVPHLVVCAHPLCVLRASPCKTAVPGSGDPLDGQRAGFRLAVADHAAREQIRVVEHRAVCVQQRVAELAALVDRPGRLRRDVAGAAAGEGELAEQPAQPLLVVADVGVDLRVGALEVDVGPIRRLVLGSTSDYLERHARSSLLVLPRVATSPGEDSISCAHRG